MSPTRSGNPRRSKVDGRLLPADHEPHAAWDDLVTPAQKQPLPSRPGAFYERIKNLPSPGQLREFDPLPDSFEGMSRWQWRELARGLNRNLRKQRRAVAA